MYIKVSDKIKNLKSVKHFCLKQRVKSDAGTTSLWACWCSCWLLSGWALVLILSDHSWSQCVLFEQLHFVVTCHVSLPLCLTYSYFAVPWTEEPVNILDPAMDSSLHVAPQNQEVQLTGTTAACLDHVDCGTPMLLFAPEVFFAPEVLALKQRWWYEDMWRLNHQLCIHVPQNDPAEKQHSCSFTWFQSEQSGLYGLFKDLGQVFLQCSSKSLCCRHILGVQVDSRGFGVKLYGPGQIEWRLWEQEKESINILKACLLNNRCTRPPDFYPTCKNDTVWDSVSRLVRSSLAFLMFLSFLFNVCMKLQSFIWLFSSSWSTSRWAFCSSWASMSRICWNTAANIVFFLAAASWAESHGCS